MSQFCPRPSQDIYPASGIHDSNDTPGFLRQTTTFAQGPPWVRRPWPKGQTAMAPGSNGHGPNGPGDALDPVQCMFPISPAPNNFVRTFDPLSGQFCRQDDRSNIVQTSAVETSWGAYFGQNGTMPQGQSLLSSEASFGICDGFGDAKTVSSEVSRPPMAKQLNSSCNCQVHGLT